MALQTVEFKNWYFREFGTDEPWLSSDTSSSSTAEIFPDLIFNGIIQDPFKNQNERDVQWVSDRDWEYKSTIDIDVSDESTTSALRRQLVFEGLDTFTDVYFNNELILQTDNQFRQYTFDLKKWQQKNVLRIVFYSPLKRAEKTFEPKSLLPIESSRVFVRKAQYNYGWDWGPILITSGVYKPVKLLTFESIRLLDVFVHYSIEDDNSVEFFVDAEVLSDEVYSGLAVHHEIHDGTALKWQFESEVIGSKTSTPKEKSVNFKLWHPFTHGDPKLYELTTKLVFRGHTIDSKTKTIGFRKVELVQEDLKSASGQSFYFRINNVPTYINGTNWIPAHSFPTTVTKTEYQDWLQLQKQANQNMLRIWGGGLYESDYLYEEADRLGILIWQDFLFACGQYPGNSKFVENVKHEVTDQLHRLRDHPSIVLYAGNNEDYQTIEDYSIPEKEFYARNIYENLLPGLVNKYHPNVAYIRGSPWSPDGRSASDLTVGDVHQWNVWHGKEFPYQNWSELAGRFISEFGMLALPNLETYKQFIDDPNELHPQSKTVELHNKALGFEKKLIYYVYDNLKISNFALEDYVYYTQLIQAECHTFALTAFRRNWSTDGNRLTSGQLIWQLNDTYPVASWALVDHYKRPKLGYYAIKRQSEPVTIGFDRYSESVDVPEAEKGSSRYTLSKKKHFIDVWVSNLTLETYKGDLRVEFYNVETSEIIDVRHVLKKVIDPNSTTELVLKHELSTQISENNIAVSADFHSELAGATLAKTTNWSQPLKYVKFDPNSKVEYKAHNGFLEVWSDQIIKAVSIEVSSASNVFLEDNGFDLLPGEKRSIKAPGLRQNDEVSIRIYS